MNREWYTQYKKEILLFIVAFCVQTIVFLLLWQWFVVLGHLPQSASHYPVNEGDSLSYHILSQNLLQGNGYSLSSSSPFVPESFRLPGYPFFLYFFQLLGFPIVLIIFLQMMLGSGTVVLTYLLGKKFLSEKVATVASVLLCIEPTSVFFSTFVMSDTIFVFTLLLSIYLFFHKRESFKKDLYFLFLSGVLLGFAVLTRTIALYLPPLLILAYSVLYAKDLQPISKNIVRVAVYAAGILLIIAPWSLRNYSLYRAFDLSATPYVNFTLYNLPLFYAYNQHIPLAEAFKIYYAPFASTTPPVQSLANKAVFEKLMDDSLQGNYLAYLKFHIIKTLPFFVTDGTRDINRITGIIPIPPDQTNFSDMLLRKDIAGIIRSFTSPSPNLWMLLAGSIPWILITSLWLFALTHALVKRSSSLWFICFASLIILYFAFLTGPVTEHRYRIPAAPFMLLLAVQGTSILWHILKNRYSRISP